MPFAVKMGNGGTGFLGKQEKSLRSAKKWAARRRVKDGFPVLKPFETIEQVREYLRGQTVTCLLCGRELKKLTGSHMMRIHGIGDEEYRRRYGIPLTYGLCSEDAIENYRAASIRRLDDDDPYRDNLRKVLENARKSVVEKKPQHRKPVSVVQRQRNERILKSMGRDEMFTDADAEEFLSRIKMGRTPKEVSSDTDMPGLAWWRQYRSSNAGYNRRVIDEWERLPFDVQARGEMLGARFLDELRKCFEAGMSDKDAAKVLGVTAMTCNRRTKEWRRPA